MHQYFRLWTLSRDKSVIWFLFKVFKNTQQKTEGLCTLEAWCLAALTDLKQLIYVLNREIQKWISAVQFTDDCICNMFFYSTKCPLNPPMCLTALSHLMSAYSQMIPLKRKCPFEAQHSVQRPSVVVNKQRKNLEREWKYMLPHLDWLAWIWFHHLPPAHASVFSVVSYCTSGSIQLYISIINVSFYLFWNSNWKCLFKKNFSQWLGLSYIWSCAQKPLID